MARLSSLTQEIEAKYLNIDIGHIEQLLGAYGATLLFETRFRRKVFDYPDQRLDAQHGWLRLRDEGRYCTLAYKQRLGVTQGSTANDAGMAETEITVSDFDTTSRLLERLGFVLKQYAENDRKSYRLGETEIDLDTWPLLPTYLEIEGPSWLEVDRTAELLGLNPEHKLICSTNQLYKRAGINPKEYLILTFDEQVTHHIH